MAEMNSVRKTRGSQPARNREGIVIVLEWQEILICFGNRKGRQKFVVGLDVLQPRIRCDSRLPS
jgi:hypothetical protein